MKFSALAFELYLPQKRVSHTHTYSHADRHTDRYFREKVKSCSGPPKTCKSTNKQKSKIFKKPILSSIYIEEKKQ